MFEYEANLSKRKCVEAKLGLRCNGRVGGVVCFIVCLFEFEAKFESKKICWSKTWLAL